jgi:hypothetical protein
LPDDAADVVGFEDGGRKFQHGFLTTNFLELA